jgi:hypothetical protein
LRFKEGPRPEIELDFRDADSFSDGLAAVHKGGWGYIDRIGKVVVPPRYLQARRFSEGGAGSISANLSRCIARKRATG